MSLPSYLFCLVSRTPAARAGVLVLSLFTLLSIARAQSAPSETCKPEQTKAAESLPELVRRVKPSVVSVLTYDARRAAD